MFRDQFHAGERRESGVARACRRGRGRFRSSAWQPRRLLRLDEGHVREGRLGGWPRYSALSVNANVGCRGYGGGEANKEAYGCGRVHRARRCGPRGRYRAGRGWSSGLHTVLHCALIVLLRPGESGRTCAHFLCEGEPIPSAQGDEEACGGPGALDRERGLVAGEHGP
ncbi:hypothetical protein ANANG_G00013290 [Anguilla anguilla]|uniref:Uncharacterized protein n=1 Tax=Anguilla anguilla TaxID=7936 RepID=A0A9D3N160_ANGAN|nr:hypothetical protein ANANG_G00013290 [Anguilla anguilla]